MLILVVLLVFAGLTLVLYRHFRAKHGSRALWRSSVAIGSSVGIARAVLACLGWYGVEHTGGPLQIPAYALAMLALPEGRVFGQHRGPLSLNVYISLGFLLIVSTLLLVCGVALAVQLTRHRRDISESSR